MKLFIKEELLKKPVFICSVAKREKAKADNVWHHCESNPGPQLSQACILPRRHQQYLFSTTSPQQLLPLLSLLIALRRSDLSEVNRPPFWNPPLLQVVKNDSWRFNWDSSLASSQARYSAPLHGKSKCHRNRKRTEAPSLCRRQHWSQI